MRLRQGDGEPTQVIKWRWHAMISKEKAALAPDLSVRTAKVERYGWTTSRARRMSFWCSIEASPDLSAGGI
jgi:hypothetical protein